MAVLVLNALPQAELRFGTRTSRPWDPSPMIRDEIVEGSEFAASRRWVAVVLQGGVLYYIYIILICINPGKNEGSVAKSSQEGQGVLYPL